MKDNDKGYLPFEKWVWKKYDGKQAISINDFIKEQSFNETFFMIGTDSQNYSKKRMCVFTTVLIAYRLGKGGSVVLHRDKVPYIQSLRQRLILEAMRSLETAWYIEPIVPSKNIIEIHLDVNPNLKYRSGSYKDELIGLVAGQGYKCIIKPDAFAASGVADRKC